VKWEPHRAVSISKCQIVVACYVQRSAQWGYANEFVCECKFIVISGIITYPTEIMETGTQLGKDSSQLESTSICIILKLAEWKRTGISPERHATTRCPQLTWTFNIFSIIFPLSWYPLYFNWTIHEYPAKDILDAFRMHALNCLIDCEWEVYSVGK